MSGFCVFGIARTHCKKRAERNVESYDSDLKRHLTADEFAARVEALAAQLFEGGVRLKQISPAFDAPQFARDWIAVGLQTNSIRSPKIMVRCVKTDKNGAPMNNKKGLPVISWLPYTAQAKAAA